MNVCTSQTRGMGSAEADPLDIGRRSQRNIGAISRANVNFAIGESGEQLLSRGKGLWLPGDDHRGIRAQRVGVHGGDKNRCCLSIQRRYFAVWASAQGRPLTTLNQLAPDCLCVQAGDSLGGVCLKALGVIAIDFDDH